MSIGIIDGDTSFINVQGDAKISDKPVDKNALYYIASVTKSFTATTLLLLLQDFGDGRNAPTLKSKIASLIPADFALPDDYATAHATLDDALGHLLGTGDQNLNYGGNGYILGDAVRSLRHLSMTAELREKHQY